MYKKRASSPSLPTREKKDLASHVEDTVRIEISTARCKFQESMRDDSLSQDVKTHSGLGQLVAYMKWMSKLCKTFLEYIDGIHAPSLRLVSARRYKLMLEDAGSEANREADLKTSLLKLQEEFNCVKNEAREALGDSEKKHCVVGSGTNGNDEDSVIGDDRFVLTPDSQLLLTQMTMALKIQTIQMDICISQSIQGYLSDDDTIEDKADLEAALKVAERSYRSTLTTIQNEIESNKGRKAFSMLQILFSLRCQIADLTVRIMFHDRDNMDWLEHCISVNDLRSVRVADLPDATFRRHMNKWLRDKGEDFYGSNKSQFSAWFEQFSAHVEPACPCDEWVDKADVLDIVERYESIGAIKYPSEEVKGQILALVARLSSPAPEKSPSLVRRLTQVITKTRKTLSSPSDEDTLKALLRQCRYSKSRVRLYADGVMATARNIDSKHRYGPTVAADGGDEIHTDSLEQYLLNWSAPQLVQKDSIPTPTGPVGSYGPSGPSNSIVKMPSPDGKPRRVKSNPNPTVTSNDRGMHVPLTAHEHPLGRLGSLPQS